MLQCIAYNPGVHGIEARPSGASLKLDTPVQYVKGIGPRRAAQLAEHGIRTVAELIEYAPFRYEDRTRFRPLRSVRDGEWALVQGKIARVDGFQSRARRLSVVEIVLRDPSGEATIRFFNQPYLRSTYEAGMKLILYGQARLERRGGSVVFLSPECEIADEEGAASLHSGRVVPIYRKLGEMRTRVLRQILHAVVTRLPADGFDPVPQRVRKQLRLPDRAAAFERLHFPVLRSAGDAERARE